MLYYFPLPFSPNKIRFISFANELCAHVKNDVCRELGMFSEFVGIVVNIDA